MIGIIVETVSNFCNPQNPPCEPLRKVLPVSKGAYLILNCHPMRTLNVAWFTALQADPPKAIRVLRMVC